MKFEDAIMLKEGSILMLGNEAIARGALEGGMGLAEAKAFLERLGKSNVELLWLRRNSIKTSFT